MIDKMYMMFPSYKEIDGKLKYVSYNNELSINKQPIEALQNRLIELYKSVLLNENVIKDVMTPIDFDHIKQDIRSMFKQVPISNLSLYDPIADIETKYSFLAGKSLVGQEANALIDYVLGSLSDINITNFELSKGNIELDEEYSQELDNNDLEYYKKELNLSNEQVEGLKKIKISHSLSAVLNAAVDIAKDPYITEGNWVTMTTNTGNLLLRKGVHPFYVNAFLAQPIIKEYIDFTEQYEKSDSQSLSSRDEFKKQYTSKELSKLDGFSIRDKYVELSDLYLGLVEKSDMSNKKAKEIKKGNNSFVGNNILKFIGLSNEALSAEELNSVRNLSKQLTDIHSEIFFPSGREIIENNSLSNIRKNLDGSNVSFQAKVFNDFLRYQNASKALKMNIDASKFMVNGMGKNITSLNIAKNLVDNILFQENKYNNLVREEVENNTISKMNDKGSFRGNIITGFSSKFRNPNGSESMLSQYYNNIILGVQNIVKANPKLFLSANETVQNTFDEISYSIYDTILIDDNLGTQLEKDFYSFAISGFNPFQIDIQERRDLITKFPEEFKQFKEDNKELYPIIDQLIVKSGETFDFISMSNRKKSTEFEETLTNSWYDLMQDHPEFSDKLVQYSFFTSGFAMNINQFYTYIPAQWFIQNKINRFIIDQSNSFTNSNENINEFTDQFFMSNIENLAYIKSIFNNQIDYDKTKFVGKGFIGKYQGKSSYFVNRVVKLEDNSVVNIPYKLLGYTSEFKPIYTRFIPNINGELIDVRNLNVKDRQGNKIINYNTEGLILKSSNAAINNLIDKNYFDELNNQVTYPRDYFFKQDYIDNKQDYFNKVSNDEEIFSIMGAGDYYKMIEEFGEEYVKEYIKKCK